MFSRCIQLLFCPGKSGFVAPSFLGRPGACLVYRQLPERMGSVGLTREFFLSLGKEMCIISLWKWACLSIGGSVGVPGGGGAHLPVTCERDR